MKHRSDHARGRLSSESNTLPWRDHRAYDDDSSYIGKGLFHSAADQPACTFPLVSPSTSTILPRHYASIEIAGRLIPTGPVIMTTRPTDKIEWARNENLSVCTGNCFCLRRFVTLRDERGGKCTYTCTQSERDREMGRMYRNTEPRKSRCTIGGLQRDIKLRATMMIIIVVVIIIIVISMDNEHPLTRGRPESHGDCDSSIYWTSLGKTQVPALWISRIYMKIEPVLF